MRLSPLGILALSAVALSLCFAPTASANKREPRFCEDPGILRKITSRFRHQVKNVPHLPDVAILEYRTIHEHRYLPYNDQFRIARRYCGATVALSDGDHRSIWYLIEDGMGFAGIGDNVEFCVSGFDRWLVYNGGCRVLR